MQDLVNIFIKSIFIDNMVFAYFLGMCSYLAVSKTVKTSMGLGIAVIFVLGITVPVNYLIEKFLLSEGALSWLGSGFDSVNLGFLSFIVFIAEKKESKAIVNSTLFVHRNVMRTRRIFCVLEIYIVQCVVLS